MNAFGVHIDYSLTVLFKNAGNLKAAMEIANETQDMIRSMQEQISVLQQEVFYLKQQLNVRDETKLERFYQQYLETKYKATHKKSVYGVSDIETEHFIIEIKNWKQYKSCLGQVLAYTHKTDKTRIAYFFGNKPKTLDNVLRLFTDYAVDVYHIQYINNEVVEENLVKIVDNNAQELDLWLAVNIRESRGELITLSDVAVLYHGKECTKKELTHIRKGIEKWLHKRFPRLPHEIGTHKRNGKCVKGWKDVQFVKRNWIV